MLPHLDAFLAGIRLFARRRRERPVAFDEPILADAIAHARQLAAFSEGSGVARQRAGGER